MKKHLILLFLSPLVLFAQNNNQGKLLHLTGFPKDDSIPARIQPTPIQDASTTDFEFETALPLNTDSMSALFKKKALDFSQRTSYTSIYSNPSRGKYKTLDAGQDATYALMQVQYSTGTKYSASSDLKRWTRALHDNHYVDKTDSQKRGESRFGFPGLYIGN